MINKKTILAHMYQHDYKPRSYQELLAEFEIGPEQETAFCRLIGRMEKKGEIVRTRQDRYGLPEHMNLVKGVISINPRGYGILAPDEHGEQEIFVYGRNLNGAMHMDRVMVRLSNTGRAGARPEGEVIRAIERANREIVGVYKRTRSTARVVPDDPRQIYPVYVTVPRRIRVKDGDRVLVELYAWPDKDKEAEGRILEVIGDFEEPIRDVDLIIKKHGLQADFSDRVLAEARKAPQTVGEADLSGRWDLRSWPTVTIDGEDAKDLDDAVTIDRTEQGYRLGVHIADVSHYVKENSRLDREAYNRATSVYLINRVLPMLPPELSSGICSLNAGQDRLAMSCIMEMDGAGRVLSSRIGRSVIQVDERMTYTAVNLILNKDPEMCLRYAQMTESFAVMHELAEKLKAARMARGALDFDFPESKVILEDDGEVREVLRVERGPAESLIEEFMIRANETVAAYLYGRDIPLLFRVHERPDPEAMLKLNGILGMHGYSLDSDHLQPADIQKILQGIKGKPEESTLSLMLLRSMKHARYVPRPLGHFGLACEYYCHFTSPIRRYPDLLVHRMLGRHLDAGTSSPEWQEMRAAMFENGDHCTIQEIKAEEAERALVAIKKVRYISHYLGNDFEGRISSLTSFGFFVELPNLIEGLVHISSLADDYYDFNDRAMTLTGRYSGRTYRIGDSAFVKVVRADIANARVDLQLAAEGAEGSEEPKPQSSRDQGTIKKTGTGNKPSSLKKTAKSGKGRKSR